MNTVNTNSPEIIKAGGKLIWNAFKSDAVIRYLGLPRPLKRYVERKFFEGEVERSEVAYMKDDTENPT
jgi:hypothetical protein